MAKKHFQQLAATKGVNASYSGKDATMHVTGEDTKVKAFIRICNLKGKAFYPFAIKQG